MSRVNNRTNIIEINKSSIRTSNSPRRNNIVESRENMTKEKEEHQKYKTLKTVQLDKKPSKYERMKYQSNQSINRANDNISKSNNELTLVKNNSPNKNNYLKTNTMTPDTNGTNRPFSFRNYYKKKNE